MSASITKLNPLAQKLQLRLDEDQLTNCMRCGFCLPACPTFQETGIEAESPRGRIALMKAVADGLMEPDDAFEEQMNHCLGCRACEPACPADVKYGQLIEQARDAIEDHTTSHRWWVKGLRKTMFRGIFPKQERMQLLGRTMALYQRSGLQRLARGSGLMKLLPSHLAEMEAILPPATGRGVIERIGDKHPAKGERIGTVGLFRGCIMDVMFTDTNIKTVELLTEAGFDVVIPQTQQCCGALHAHSGEPDGARALARGNIKAFKTAEVDFIATNAGGCGAILVEYDHLLYEDQAWQADAEWFSSRVMDISDLLVRHGRLPRFLEPVAAGKEEVRITYQDSCHLRNVMRSADAPRTLMRQVEGISYVELPDADRCCGSAGIYNITQPEMASSLLEGKMQQVETTGATHVLTSNPGCLLQMKLGEHRCGGSRRVEHLVDFLHDRLVKQ